MAELIHYEQDGVVRRTSPTFQRGEHVNFFPHDDSMGASGFVADYFVKGLVPAEPVLEPGARIVAFGSCFAAHVSGYLTGLGFEVLGHEKAAITRMGDGIVNTFAIRQQFEWVWGDWRPSRELWHGYDARAIGADEEARLATRALFDQADAFIITLGLSEVWYDEPSGDVFWRAVPVEEFDPARHKFRSASASENRANLEAIVALIRRRRPQAKIILTLSPIPLVATFRPVACTAANAVSKASLRAAIDELCAGAGDADLWYFPSYEIALGCFEAPFMEDRRHVHAHVLEFNMKAFERWFCRTGLTDADVEAAWVSARVLDRRVVNEGHWSAPRINIKDSRPRTPRPD
jgi:hypothetical protein